MFKGLCFVPFYSLLFQSHLAESLLANISRSRFYFSSLLS